MTATLFGTRVQVREAVANDDGALRAIAAACPMEGDISLRITRDPDFFHLNQLEGSQWRVGVAEVDGRVVGCVMGAERIAYLHGVEQRTLYAGDLKVLPTMRGTGIAEDGDDAATAESLRRFVQDRADSRFLVRRPAHQQPANFLQMRRLARRP